ncbi:MAG: winged helix-turn-helix domain-containing protein [Pyrinomonadaceae bacterium]
MDDPEIQIYEFDQFRIDAVKRLLFKGDGEIVPLMPRAFDTLLYLVRHNGKVIEKNELLDEVWADTIVEENNLTQNISILRRVFGETPGEHRFIVTVPGHGYKFVAEVNGLDKSPKIDDRSGADFEVENRQTEKSAKKNSVEHLHPAADERSNRLRLAVLGTITILGLASIGFYYFRGAGEQTPDQIRSIAVLPFKPLILENRDQSFEIGMTDTLISKLASSDNLVVRPLNAVRKFDSAEQDLTAAGRALGVEAILDGSIQIVGDRVQISAKLFRVGDSKQLWAGRFNEKLEDIFAVQDSISEKVAAELKVRLGYPDKKRYTENVEAYKLYVRGKFHLSKLVLPEVLKGISYFEQAIAIDPNYALAHAGVADAYIPMALTNDARPNEVMPKARAAALVYCFR